MDLLEFEREFDIIYENIDKGGAPGLLPYEKSVILTQAQEALVRSLLSAKSYDAIADLISTVHLDPSITTDKIDDRSIVFLLPEDYLALLNESVIDSDDFQYPVLPVSYVEYTALMMKPYKYPRRSTAWRLLNTSSSSAKIVEILGRPVTTLEKYRATVVNYPGPIILDASYTIRGITGPVNTNLKESLHPSILEHAVSLAEKYYYDKSATENVQQ